MRVSAIIPTFGRAASLARAVTALRRQSVSLAEIMIIDQNPSGWLQGQLGTSLHGTKLVSVQPANASTARNLGATIAKGDLLLFLDDDLVPDADFVARLLARFTAHPDVGCLCPVIVSSTTQHDWVVGRLRKKRVKRHRSDPSLWAVRDTISATMCFRRTTYFASGGFDEVLFAFARAGEDQELCWRMGRRGLPVWIDTTLAIYHDEGVPGGCGLRSQEYWESRRRVLRTITLCARLQNRGKLSARDGLRLVRSAFLNSMIVRHPPLWAVRNARLLAEAVASSRRFLDQQGIVVDDVRHTDYLRRHVHLNQQANVGEVRSCG